MKHKDSLHNFLLGVILAALTIFNLRAYNSVARPLQGHEKEFSAGAIATQQQGNQSKTLVEAPPNLLTLEDVLILHMGKAGGTNVKIRTHEHWRLAIEECHPFPCRTKRLRSPNTYLLPTLRDPVDRFVSAFYWRIERLCHDIPESERNYGEYSGCQTWDKPSPQLIDMLYRRRRKSVSLLAQDLCSSNSTTRQVARQDVRRILHLKENQDIISWFDFDFSAKVDQIFPLVLEKGALAYEPQIDTAIHWLYNQTQFEDLNTFVNRRRHVEQREEANHTKYRSSSAVKQALTPVAERCLESYYRKDYEMLPVIQRKLCKTLHCREAIQMILDRRKRVFQDSIAESSTLYRL